MKKLLALLSFVLPLCAQPTAYQATPATAYTALKQILDSKPHMTSGSVTPTGNCTAGLDFYLKTGTPPSLYHCPVTNSWATVVPALNFTTTGSSGAATYNPSTNSLNIPQYSGGTVAAAGIYCPGTGGASNALTCTGSPSPSTFVAGMQVLLLVDAANTGSVTLNISGIGAKAVYNNNAVLSAGDLQPGLYQLSSDTTKFNIVGAGIVPIPTTPGILGINTSGGPLQLASLATFRLALCADPYFAAFDPECGASPNASTSQLTQLFHGIGAAFDGGGSALSAGKTVYFTFPYSCSIAAWNMTVDTGTATVDLWKIASGTALPTISNSITASATPAISTGNAIHSTTLTGWTTAVTANDIFGINLKAVSGATQVSFNAQCQ